MSPIVAEAFAAELAGIVAGGRVADVPEPPLYWGSDLSCVTDCDAMFTELAPGSALIVAQAAVRRLITPRGALLDDADYGFDLRGYCNRGVTLEDLRTLQNRAEAEVLKDERLSAAAINITIEYPSGLTVTGELTPADPSFEPFAFVVAVTDAEVLIELI